MKTYTPELPISQQVSEVEHLKASEEIDMEVLPPKECVVYTLSIPNYWALRIAQGTEYDL